MEQNLFYFDHLIEKRDEPVSRPEPTRPKTALPSPARPVINARKRVISHSVKEISKWNFNTMLLPALKTVVSTFELIFSIDFEIIAFIVKPFFATLSFTFGYNWSTTYCFQNLIISHERTSIELSKSL